MVGRETIQRPIAFGDHVKASVLLDEQGVVRLAAH